MTARERFEHYFCKSKHVFIVALHVTADAAMWRADIDTAFKCGADGIIVIRDRDGTNEDVITAYNWARDRYDDAWIGVNLLGYPPVDAVLTAPKGVSGIWFDEAYIDEDIRHSNDYLRSVQTRSEIFHVPRCPLLMPSIAMKYQPPVRDIAKVAKMAEPFADVLVTSGDRTGVPPTIAKMRAMREAVKVPIGIASGINVDNVESFVDLGVEVFIVNTSLNTDGRLDPAKIHALRDKIPQ